MKNIRSILVLTFLCTLCVANITSYAQTSITGAINTMAVSNSIIRSEGDSLVVYSEFEGQGHFHLLSSLANGSIVKVANVPELQHVYRPVMRI